MANSNDRSKLQLPEYKAKMYVQGFVMDERLTRII